MHVLYIPITYLRVYGDIFWHIIGIRDENIYDSIVEYTPA